MHDSLVLRGSRAEVQLSGEAEEVDGTVIKGVPEGVLLHPHVVPPGHAGVVGQVKPLNEGHAALST